MFEDSMDPVDLGDGSGEQVEVTESSADQPVSGASGPVGEPAAEQEVSSGPARGPRLVRPRQPRYAAYRGLAVFRPLRRPSTTLKLPRVV